MLRFILRRLLQMVGVVFVLSLLVFLWLRSLPGGTVSAILGEKATPERRAALEKALGLDQPLYVQYWEFVKRAAQGPVRRRAPASSRASTPSRSSSSASPRPSS